MQAHTVLIAMLVTGGMTLAVLARDLEPHEILALQQQQLILPFETLRHRAQQAHPQARIVDSKLEDAYSNYIYEVELQDADGVEWDVDLNAATGQIIRNHQSD